MTDPGAKSFHTPYAATTVLLAIVPNAAPIVPKRGISTTLNAIVSAVMVRARRRLRLPHDLGGVGERRAVAASERPQILQAERPLSERVVRAACGLRASYYHVADIRDVIRSGLRAAEFA